MSEDALFTLTALMLALPPLVVVALALVVVWNLINPFKGRW